MLVFDTHSHLWSRHIFERPVEIIRGEGTISLVEVKLPTGPSCSSWNMKRPVGALFSDRSGAVFSGRSGAIAEMTSQSPVEPNCSFELQCDSVYVDDVRYDTKDRMFAPPRFLKLWRTIIPFA
jgi:hypothetical protein